MDLQTERLIEQYLKLANLTVIRIEPRMEFVLPPLHHYIEYVNNRILLSLSSPIDPPRRDEVLPALLRRCVPARTSGVPLRAYVVKNRLVLSCSPAPNTDVRHWLSCGQVMRRLLDTRTGENL